MTFVCPICQASTNSKGDPFSGELAVRTHIAGKAHTGDPDHFRWVDHRAPNSLARSATVFQIAEALRPFMS
jgi:hypothetical protein